MVTNFLFGVGPLLRGFPHSKKRLRVSRVLTHQDPLVGGSDTQEPVARKKSVSRAKNSQSRDKWLYVSVVCLTVETAPCYMSIFVHERTCINIVLMIMKS